MKQVLLLEDNPEVLSEITFLIEGLQPETGNRTEIKQFSTRVEANEYLNAHPEATFDLVLLDKNDANDESFHDLPLEKLGVEKIVSISSVPRSNEEARARGVTHVVLKDYHDLGAFADSVKQHIRDILQI